MVPSKWPGFGKISNGVGTGRSCGNETMVPSKWPGLGKISNGVAPEWSGGFTTGTGLCVGKLSSFLRNCRKPFEESAFLRGISFATNCSVSVTVAEGAATGCSSWNAKAGFSRMFLLLISAYCEGWSAHTGLMPVMRKARIATVLEICFRIFLFFILGSPKEFYC